MERISRYICQFKRVLVGNVILSAFISFLAVFSTAPAQAHLLPAEGLLTSQLQKTSLTDSSNVVHGEFLAYLPFSVVEVEEEADSYSKTPAPSATVSPRLQAHLYLYYRAGAIYQKSQSARILDRIVLLERFLI